MPASESASAAPGDENRFASLSPASLSRTEKSSIVKLALAVLSSRYRPGRAFTAPEDIQRFLRLKLTGRRNEVFRRHLSGHPPPPDRNRRAVPGHRRRGGRVPARGRAAGAREERRGLGALSQPPLRRGGALRVRPRHHAEAKQGSGSDRRAASRSPCRHRRRLRQPRRERLDIVRTNCSAALAADPSRAREGSGRAAVPGEPEGGRSHRCALRFSFTCAPRRGISEELP